MDRFSNTILGSLNFFLLSIPILSSGIWLGFNALTQCEVFFYKPMIALGAFLMIIAIIGLIGSCCKVTWILWFYVVVMFLLIICVLCFTFFAFVVTRVGSGEAIPGKAYKEYRLEDYFGWMQDRVNYVKHWDNIRSCLRKNGHICNSLELFSANETFYAFYKHDLTAFESGCCKPSNDCNFIYINATTWYNTTESTPHKNSDCQLWDNDKKKLCYNCNACKAGFLDSLKDSWKIVANVNIIFIIILAVFFAMGCYVFINTKREATYYVRSNGLDNP